MKRLLTMLVLLLALGLLAACGAAAPATEEAEPVAEATEAAPEAEPTEAAEPEAEPTEAATEEAAEPTEEAAEPTEEAAGSGDSAVEALDPSDQTVTFWHQHTRERETELLALVEEFNSTNEFGITVVAENAGGYGDIYNKMIAGITAGEVPELVVAYQNQAAAYQFADGLVDLTPFIESEKWGLTEEDRADFFASFVNSDYNAAYGQQLGFPPNRSAEVVYYNQDMLTELGFEAPATTPEEFREMTCAAAEAGYVGYELAADASRFASFVFSFGGDLMNEDQSAYTLDDPAAVEAMTFLQGLFTDGCAMLVAEEFGDQADFGTGKLLFTVGSSSGLPFYESAVAEGYGGAWSVAALPHTTPDPVVNVYGASVSIPKTTPEAELAAWLFLKWYTEPVQQARWVRASNYFPVRSSVADELGDYFAENPTFETAYGLLEYGYAEPPVAGYDVVREMITEAMIEIVEGADAAETLADLNVEANEALAEFQP